MSTRAQRRANRRNAELSTGPRTPEGKAVSSRNAIKHNLSGTTFVLLPGEDRVAFEALAREYRNEWRPRTPHETFLVTQMIQSRWRLNRIARMEAEVLDAMFLKFGDGQSDEGAIIIADRFNPDALGRLRRYAQDAERSYHRAVRELRAYRKDQPQPVQQEAPAQPANVEPSMSCEEIQNEPGCMVQPRVPPHSAGDFAAATTAHAGPQALAV